MSSQNRQDLNDLYVPKSGFKNGSSVPNIRSYVYLKSPISISESLKLDKSSISLLHFTSNRGRMVMPQNIMSKTKKLIEKIDLSNESVGQHGMPKYHKLTDIDHFSLENLMTNRGEYSNFLVHKNETVTNSLFTSGKFHFDKLPNVGGIRDGYHTTRNFDRLNETKEISPAFEKEKFALGDSIHISYDNEMTALRNKIIELTDINRNLLNIIDNKITLGKDEVISIYHMLYIDDYKKQIYDLQTKVNFLRRKIDQLKSIIRDKDKENQDLKEFIDKHRSGFLDGLGATLDNKQGILSSQTTMQDMHSSKTSYTGLPLISTVHEPIIKITEKEKKPKKQDIISKLSLASKHVKNSESISGPYCTTRRIYTKSLSEENLFERFDTLIVKSTKIKSLKHFLQTILNESLTILDVAYSRILLTNLELKKIFEAEGGTSKGFLCIGGHDIDILSKQDFPYPIEAVLNKMNDMNELRLFKNIEGDVISTPIHSITDKDQIWFILQVCDYSIGEVSEKSKKKMNLGIRNEHLVHFFIKILGILADCLINEDSLQKFKAKHKLFIDSMSIIQSNKNLQDFLYIAKKVLPTYFGFEHFNMVFYSQSDNTFFTYDTHKQADGIYYTTECIKMNSKVGLVGHVFHNSIEIFYDNNPRINSIYAPENDNCGGSVTAKNLMLGLLIDENKKKIGVLQLMNKQNGMNITSADEDLLKAILKILGNIVSHCSQVSDAIGLAHKLRDTVKNLGNKLNL